MRRERALKDKIAGRLAVEVNMDVKSRMNAALRNLSVDDSAPANAELEGMLRHFIST